MTAKLPILLYHDLKSPDYSNEKSGEATMDTVVQAKNFENQIRYLAEKGYETISLREYFNLRAKKASFPPKKIIITFDDGHYSNYHIAFPVLQKYGFKATFFVIAEKVDSKYHLTGDQIKEMADKGMEIGSHGLTHNYLPLMEAGKIEYELGESKRYLESVIKKPVDYFAFPGGHYNQNVLELLPLYGYKGTCSCLQGLNDSNTNPYLLKRIEIRNKFSADAFEYVFHPIHIAFYQLIDLGKHLIRRTLGLEAYMRLRKNLYKFYIFKR